MEKKAIRYKWILYVTMMFVVMVLQTTILSHITIFGASAMHLLLFAVATIAMLEGTTSGALAGLFTGVISDAMLPISDGFYTILYVFCGILVSFASGFVFWKNYWVTLLYLLVSIFVCRFVYYVFFFVLFGNAHVLSLFWSIPAEFFITALFTPVLYPLIVKISRRTNADLEA